MRSRIPCRYLSGFVLLLLSMTAVAADPPPPPSALQGVRIDPATVVGKDGFFRVGRSVNGRWWLVDPEGRPFYFRGAVAINRAGTQGGRRAKPGAYAEAVDARYGWPVSPDRFVTETFARLEAWGFNALGAWTTEEFHERGVPYTEILEFYKHVDGAPVLAGTKVPDVYSDRWAKIIDAKARQICASRRDSRMLVGYFTSNEIGFGELMDYDKQPIPSDTPVKSKEIGLLQRCLGGDADAAATREAWAFVTRRHGSTAAAARAWKLPQLTPQALAKLTEAGQAVFSAGFLEDNRAWTLQTAERYFRMASEAIRRHDSNHLILGSRWGAPPSAAMLQAEARHVDVISANNYRKEFYERIDIYHRATGKPVLIADSDYVQPDPSRTPEQHKAAAGQVALLRLATHPGVVGYGWYRWVQNSQYGLVNTKDEPHAVNIAALAQANRRMEAVAAASDAALKAAPPVVDGRVRLVLQKSRLREQDGWLRADTEETIFLDAEQGRWPESFSGRGLSGRVRSAATDGRDVTLTLEGVWTDPKGQLPPEPARYTVTLTQVDRRLEGTLVGSHNGREIRGVALGWFGPLLAEEKQP